MSAWGIVKSSETYRRQIVLEDPIGGTGKITLRRLLRIAFGVKNYVSLDSVPTQKRANSMIYYLSKSRKQIVILDLVRRPVIDSSMEFVEKKVKRAVLTELGALTRSEQDENFLKKFNVEEYKAQFKE